MSQKLPLFPLTTVLFPGALLPLHIFEERYRLMIGRCIEQQSPFGVVLIREPELTDVDPNVTFYPIGTSAAISEQTRLDDGRYYLVATGQQRFKVQYLTQRAPYMIGAVNYLPEESGTTVVEATNDLRVLYQRYWQVLAHATGQQYQPETLPDDVIEMTYWMANRLQIEMQQKQRLLEADVATRLREMTAALRAELALLPSNTPGPDANSWFGSSSWN